MSSQLTSFYTSLTSEVGGLLAGERDPIANMANISALVSEKLNVDRDVNWVGFYLMKRNAQKHELVVGPFQGKPACVRIRVGRGVCGTAVEKGVPQVVSDVEKFPGHIACDATSRSEIVIPLRRGEDEVLGVLDLDSTELSTFTDDDRMGLTHVAEQIVNGSDWSLVGDLRPHVLNA